jgi:hypothetical protein
VGHGRAGGVDRLGIGNLPLEPDGFSPIRPRRWPGDRPGSPHVLARPGLVRCPRPTPGQSGGMARATCAGRRRDGDRSQFPAAARDAGLLRFPLYPQIVADPTGFRRVWYLQVDGRQDSQTKQAVQHNREAGEFSGPWDALLRLYEGAPDQTGIPFANGLRFHGLDILDSTLPAISVRREGETIRLRLWWSVDRLLDRDYSIGVYVLGPDGALLASADGAPAVRAAPWETSRWTPGVYYIDHRELVLPPSMVTASYPLFMAVYQSQDNVRVAAPGVRDDLLLTVGRLWIKAW